jgi:glycosyltransferase involved in cell wall biosynthesis
MGTMLLWLTAAVLALVAVNAIFWPKVSPQARAAGEVSVLIPARNEAANLPGCLESVLAQPSVAEVLVYDDHSEDPTPAVVKRFAAGEPRLRLLEPRPLPPGWCGKTFACQTLAEEARSQWLLFVDADVVLAPGAVPAVLAEAERRGVTLLSCWPGLRMSGFWEGLLMPMLNFVVFTLYPAPLALRRPRDPSLGLAHGALMLARREAYRRVGGHRAVRGELFEDTLLARLWRLRGERSLCLDGQQIVRTRMYAGLRPIWRGFQKNFYPAFRSPVSFWGFLAFHALVFLAPFLAGYWPAAGSVIAMRLALALRFRHPVWSALLHPLAQGLLLALGLASWWRYRHGPGVEWKGRRYAAR